MNLPPALTWLQLFPTGTTCACDSGPGWFQHMLQQRVNGEQPRVLAVWDKRWNELGDLGAMDGIMAVNCSEVTVKRLASSGFSYIRQFAVIPNLATARWFISLDSASIASAAFSLYTPARASARVKKSLISLAAQFRMPFWYRDQIIIAQRQPPPLETALAGLFPERMFRVALSSGAPEPALNRKASAVILGQGGEILGYVKIAGSKVSRRILEHEAEVLTALEQRRHMKTVTPRLLFAGEVDGRYLTVQSPIAGRPAPSKMTLMHQEYLAAMSDGPMKSAASTHMVTALRGRIDALPPNRLDLGAMLDQIMPALQLAQVRSTIVHGDFAPWNLRLHQGHISAFDWEYGELDGLPLLDEIHYVLQLGYLLKEWDLDRAHHCMEALANRTPLGLTPEQVRAIESVYLLDHVVRLVGEGYDVDDDMVSWYRKLLARLGAVQREVVLA